MNYFYLIPNLLDKNSMVNINNQNFRKACSESKWEAFTCYNETNQEKNCEVTGDVMVYSSRACENGMDQPDCNSYFL